MAPEPNLRYTTEVRLTQTLSIIAVAILLVGVIYLFISPGNSADTAASEVVRCLNAKDTECLYARLLKPTLKQEKFARILDTLLPNGAECTVSAMNIEPDKAFGLVTFPQYQDEGKAGSINLTLTRTEQGWLLDEGGLIVGLTQGLGPDLDRYKILAKTMSEEGVREIPLNGGKAWLRLPSIQEVLAGKREQAKLFETTPPVSPER